MRLIDADEMLNHIGAVYTAASRHREYGYKEIMQEMRQRARHSQVEAIPIDKPFLKMKYKGYTVYKTEWLKEHIEMEYRVIKGISKSKAEAIPVEWLRDYVSHWVSEPYKNFVLQMITKWEKENGS